MADLSKLPRPRVLSGLTTVLSTGCGHLYITVNYNSSNHPFEIFAHLGHAGGCACSQLEALCRSISLGLRYGIPVDAYISQLKEIKCPSPTPEAGSCADAIARVLEKNSTEGGKDNA